MALQLLQPASASAVGGHRAASRSFLLARCRRAGRCRPDPPAAPGRRPVRSAPAPRRTGPAPPPVSRSGTRPSPRPPRRPRRGPPGRTRPAWPPPLRPAQLHQRHEPPEQAPALALQIRRPARQIDDLTRGRQPVQRAAGSHGACNRASSTSASTARLPLRQARLWCPRRVYDASLPHRCRPAAQGPAGPAAAPGHGPRPPAQRRFQQPDQPGIDLQEPLARRRAQGQRHDRITGRGGVEGRR